MDQQGHAVEHFAAQLPRLRALCIGDVMLDRFVDGSVERISPESPVQKHEITGAEQVEQTGGEVMIIRSLRLLDNFDCEQCWCPRNLSPLSHRTEHCIR